MEQLRLPRLAGTREAVGDLLAEQQVASSLRGEDLVVLCRDLASASTSFADQLVKEVVEERGAAALVLVGAPDRFVQLVRESAARRGASDRVKVQSGAEAGV